MSVFDKSYRKYDGEFKGRWSKIWAITSTTFRVQFSGKKIIFLTILCNLPVLSFTLMLLFFAIFSPAGLEDMFFGLFDDIDVAMFTIIYFTFNAALIFLPIVYICALNAGTIANDRKHNALTLYMAKPIDQSDYVIGKALSVFLISAFVTVVPWFVFLLTFTLISGMVGAAFLDSLWVYLSTLGSGIVVILFFGSIVLLFSSLSSNSVLSGILSILVLFLPSLIASILAGVVELEWLDYFSISGLILSSIHLIFGKPDYSFFGFNIFEIKTNGWISLAILLVLTAIAILITIRNLKKEEIG